MTLATLSGLEYQAQLRYEMQDLAHEMVRLEEQAGRLVRRAQWGEAGELLARREGVQEERSRLLREVWMWRHRR